MRYGKFRFLDVGDLSGQPLFDLVCPKNLVGAVDAYLTAHHGGADAAEPATLAAFQPRVVMMNNAPRKGGQRAMFEVLHRAPVENVWQLHASVDAGDLNFAAGVHRQRGRQCGALDQARRERGRVVLRSQQPHRAMEAVSDKLPNATLKAAEESGDFRPSRRCCLLSR